MSIDYLHPRDRDGTNDVVINYSPPLVRSQLLWALLKSCVTGGVGTMSNLFLSLVRSKKKGDQLRLEASGLFVES